MERARLHLFGFPATEARAAVADRDLGWRLSRGAITLIAGVGLAALAGLVPPHLPWAAAGLLVTLILAFRRLRESRTLVRLEGTCPACGGPIAVTSATRLASPHAVHCPGCGRTIELAVSDAAPT